MYRLPKRLHRFAVPTAVVLFLTACGGEGSGDAEPADADTPVDGAPAATATPDAPGEVITDVREIAFAPELEVDLDQMELRESGLYVQVLENGSGPPAASGDEMGVHYTVWLPNGFLVDSSLDGAAPEPLSMVLGQTPLIPGWVEGVTGMRLGERRKLVLPYNLGYGEQGRSPIPPYSALVFVVELAEHVPTGEG